VPSAFPDPAPLLDPSQRVELPLGMSLDLARLPLALSARRREVPDGAPAPADGQPPMLPAEYVRLAVHVVEGGVPRHVVVEGSPTLGLPFGADLDVLLALFKLAQEDHQRVLQGQSPTIVDGEFLAPTLRQIANAMGVTSNGDRPKRIRAALERLGHVRIRTTATLLRHEESRAARILAGERGTAPVVPDGRPARFGAPAATGAAGTGAAATGRPVMVEEEVTWVLEYRWRTDFSRNDDGEHWIARLRLNPLWLAHATSGWVAWVEMPIFVGLGPLAKRLYMLFAGRAACEGLVTWEFGAAELSHACAVGSGRAQGQVNRDLRLAAEDLRAAGVLAGITEERLNGELRFTFAPGPVLALAAHLRGTGTFDPDDVRLQFAALQSFGVDTAQARRWLAERPTATREAICYAVFLRETNPSHVKRSWAHLLDERIRNQRTNGGVVGFGDWAKRRLAGSAPASWPAPYPSAAGPASADASAAARVARRRGAPSAGTARGAAAAAAAAQTSLLEHETGVPDATVVEATAEARALWALVRQRASEGASMLVRSCLDAVSPVRVEEMELLVVAPDGRGEYVIQGAPRSLLLQHLADVSDGAVTTLRLLREAAPAAPAPKD
jgi:hypothetical protein